MWKTPVALAGHGEATPGSQTLAAAAMGAARTDMRAIPVPDFAHSRGEPHKLPLISQQDAFGRSLSNCQTLLWHHQICRRPLGPIDSVLDDAWKTANPEAR